MVKRLFVDRVVWVISYFINTKQCKKTGRKEDSNLTMLWANQISLQGQLRNWRKLDNCVWLRFMIPLFEQLSQGCVLICTGDFHGLGRCSIDNASAVVGEGDTRQLYVSFTCFGNSPMRNSPVIVWELLQVKSSNFLVTLHCLIEDMLY